MLACDNAAMTASRVSIQIQDFDLSAEIAALRGGDARVGAVCSFVGTVRDRNEGDAVSSMELEHYPGMTEAALGKIAAEYVLGWVPPGTHDWRKFVRPSEFATYLRRAGLEVSDFTGISYAPLEGDWMLSKDLGVNYMLAAAKPGGN